MSGSSEMQSSLAAVMAAGCETLELSAFEPQAGEGHTTTFVDTQGQQLLLQLPSPMTVYGGYPGPQSPGVVQVRSKGQRPAPSPLQSPVPQSPGFSFGQAALSPGAAIRQNATRFGIPLVMSGPSVPVPVRDSSGAVLAPSPTTRGAAVVPMLSPSSRVAGGARPSLARLPAKCLTMTMSPTSRGPQSPTVWTPMQSPGATIRQNAVSFGIPLNMSSSGSSGSRVTVPIPVRMVNGGICAPSPVCATGPQHTSLLTFGMGQPTRPATAVSASSGAAPAARSIRSIATPLRAVTRGGA